MASVAKWLRQWFVVPPFVGSIPIIRPHLKNKKAIAPSYLLVQSYWQIVQNLCCQYWHHLLN